MIIKRSEIYYCDFGYGVGHEIQGFRPALVLQSADLALPYSTVIVAPMTSNLRQCVTHVLVSRFQSGLQKDSMIMTEQLTAVDLRRLKRKIWVMPSDVMGKVDEKLALCFGRELKAKGVGEVEKLTIIENGLIPVYQSEKGNRLVNMRELHSWLGVETKFADWIKRRISEYGFIEGKDFIVLKNEKGENTAFQAIDYIFKLEPAKEIAMVENNEKGKEIRRYFIKIEEKFKSQLKQDSYMIEDPIERAQRWIEEQKEKQKLQSENASLKPKAQSFDVFMDSTGYLTVEETAKSLNIRGVGRNNLFKILNTEKILFRKGSDYESYQGYVDAGYFVHKQNPVKKGSMIEQRTQVFVTPKGLDWLARKLSKRGYAIQLSSPPEIKQTV